MRHEFDGKKYEEASAHQKEWGAKLVSELGLHGTERVLDLGCGDGVLTAQIAALLSNGEVVGVDHSQGMIEVAREKQRDNLRFVLMDIDDLDFVDEFDMVFSNATLHWIKDHKRLLGNARRSLRRNGMLRFNFAGDGNCSNLLKVIREAMKQARFTKYFSNFEWPWYMPTVGEYKSLVAQSDFQDAQVWGENADRFFQDAETVIKWVDQPSLVPFLACVSEPDKAAFRDVVIRGMIEETRQDDGRCFETFRRINVFAQK
jgi:trans-aconitate methyltransferase